MARVGLAESPGDTARRAGLRVLDSRHLTLVTDRPPRADDGVEDLPRLFDEAFDAWCRHAGLDPAAHAEWRALGCLMMDREPFRAAGLLPADGSLPDFANGFCAGGRFWMMDQSSPDYRRHLLLQEGVHAFMLTLRLAAAAPPWYAEGIAEYLATHRVEKDPAGTPRFVATPIPVRRSDVEQLGRIEQLHALRDAGRAPLLADVFSLPPRAHATLDAYAASWAAVALLANHPAHRSAFAAAERGPLDGGFTARLTGTPGFDAARADRDFAAFLADIDYGYDFSRSAIDWAQGKPLTGRVEIAVAADRGWQSAGRSIAQGQRCSFSATGRITIGQTSRLSSEDESPIRLESTPDGISLRWYRGRPLGRLLVAQWVEEPAGGGRPRFVVLAEGGEGSFTAAADGPVFCKINEPPGELADNEGRLDVTIAPAE
ncbi:MAG: hypothetical protein ACKOBP_06505 [Planctomycetia bacterium]